MKKIILFTTFLLSFGLDQNKATAQQKWNIPPTSYTTAQNPSIGLVACTTCANTNPLILTTGGGVAGYLSTSSIQFQTGSTTATTQMIIDYNGNVGIGDVATSTLNKLKVVGTGANNSSSGSFSNGSSPGIGDLGYMHLAIIKNQGGASGSNYYLLGSNYNSTKFYVKQDGNAYFSGKVGIGAFNDSPDLQLYIKGTTATNASVLVQPLAWSAVGHTAQIALGDMNSFMKVVWGDGLKLSTPNSITFGAGNTERIKVDGGTGHVGIGTPTPSERLHIKGGNVKVEGKIAATEVCVNATAAWCDYVFEPDYRLMPLNQLQSFIQKNKHLPEIPSSAEVEKDGISLSKMVTLQMKKIEEMTLYILEMEARMKKLEQK